MFLLLQSDLRYVGAKCVLHAVELQVLFDQLGNQLGVLVPVDALSSRVLPLEASCLLRLRISVGLDGVEHAGTQLSTESTQGAFILQGLDH